MLHKERVLIGRSNDGKPIYKWATGNSLDELHDFPFGGSEWI